MQLLIYSFSLSTVLLPHYYGNYGNYAIFFLFFSRVWIVKWIGNWLDCKGLAKRVYISLVAFTKCSNTALFIVRAHGIVVTNDGYLPCEPTVKFAACAVIVLLTIRSQMDKNIGCFGI